MVVAGGRQDRANAPGSFPRAPRTRATQILTQFFETTREVAQDQVRAGLCVGGGWQARRTHEKCNIIPNHIIFETAFNDNGRKPGSSVLPPSPSSCSNVCMTLSKRDCERNLNSSTMTAWSRLAMRRPSQGSGLPASLHDVIHIDLASFRFRPVRQNMDHFSASVAANASWCGPLSPFICR